MTRQTRTAPTAAYLYGFEDSVLDDDDVQVFTRAAESAFRAARDAEKRSRATAARVAARRGTTDYSPVDPAITGFLALHPAF